MPFTGRIDAPSFTLPDLAGRSVRLKDFRGRVVLLYFWATS
ncbi:MAG: redoxin domain-containing protein [candidate division NC10 bacterium]|nr:redoxin domain-containing protein [candidate division NC10 bacterium]